MGLNNLYGFVLLLFLCIYAKCEIPQLQMTGSYDYDKRMSNFTCSVNHNASHDEWNSTGNIRLIVKYDNIEKEHVSLAKLDNVTFTNALDPASQDREVFCRYQFHNNKTDQYINVDSNIVKLNKVVNDTNEKTENRTGHVTVIANKPSSFLNIGDDVYYTCESNNFTISPKLSAFQRNSKDLLEKQLARSQNTSTSTFILNVNATDHCTEIFCRAGTDEDVNVLSTRLVVQVKINGVVGECGPKEEHATPALVWYIAAGIVVFALVLVVVLCCIRDKDGIKY